MWKLYLKIPIVIMQGHKNTFFCILSELKVQNKITNFIGELNDDGLCFFEMQRKHSEFGFHILNEQK